MSDEKPLIICRKIERGKLSQQSLSSSSYTQPIEQTTTKDVKEPEIIPEAYSDIDDIETYIEEDYVEHAESENSFEASDSGPRSPIIGFKVKKQEIKVGEMKKMGFKEMGIEKEEKIVPYDIIFSHGPCIDGYTAAWIFWRNLSTETKNKLALKGGMYSKYRTPLGEGENYMFQNPHNMYNALKMVNEGYKKVFVFMKPGQKIFPDLYVGKKVLILDLDIGDQLVDVINSASHVTLIDHHISTLSTLSKNKIVDSDKFKLYFGDKTHSAASMAWKIVYNTNEIPELINIVRITDTWNFEGNYNVSKINDAMYARNCLSNFHKIEYLHLKWHEFSFNLLSEGNVISKYKNRLLKSIANKFSLGNIHSIDNGNEVIHNVAYCTSTVLHTGVGMLIKENVKKRYPRKQVHFIAIWKYVPYDDYQQGKVTVSLRDPEENIDLSIIARNVVGKDETKIICGGGHCEASSFMFTGIENLHCFIRKGYHEQ